MDWKATVVLKKIGKIENSNQLSTSLEGGPTAIKESRTWNQSRQRLYISKTNQYKKLKITIFEIESGAHNSTSELQKICRIFSRGSNNIKRSPVFKIDVEITNKELNSKLKTRRFKNKCLDSILRLKMKSRVYIKTRN